MQLDEVQGCILPFWKPPINISEEPDCHGCCSTLNVCQAMLKNCICVSRLMHRTVCICTKDIQSPSNAYKRFWFYAMKMGYLKFNFHTLVMLQFVWAPGSKQTLIRPFQKCTVHVCSLNDSKVMKCQSSRSKIRLRLGRSETMKSSICIVNRLSLGGLG